MPKRLMFLFAALLLALGPETLAGKGGDKGGGKPPKDEPPPDPAIAFFEDGALVVINEDGSNKTVVFSASRNFGRPAWSPDGSRLAFKCDVEGPGIYVINADGTGLHKVAATTSLGSADVDWSPVPAADGRFKIAFADQTTPLSDPVAFRDIFLVDPGGTGLVNVTKTPEQSESKPSWSPAADRLVVQRLDFTQLDAEILDIGVVDGALAVTGRLNLTSDEDVPGGTLNGAYVQVPVWAKTQDRIAVHADEELWAIDLADPASPVRLAEGGFPTFSPDDAELAFISWDSKPTGIYATDTNGSGATRLVYSQKTWRLDAPRWRR